MPNTNGLTSNENKTKTFLNPIMPLPLNPDASIPIPHLQTTTIDGIRSSPMKQNFKNKSGQPIILEIQSDDSYILVFNRNRVQYFYL